VSATGGGTVDFYALNILNPGSTITLDIDSTEEIRGTAFTSFAELRAAGAVAQVDRTVVVRLGADTLTINSVTLSNIADDFLFV
jgi:hypothetical protein